MTDIESARQQAAPLLGMSAQAREAGNFALADLLTQAAADWLAKTVKDHEAPARPPPSDQQQPVAQQQQIQPDKEDKSKS
jgi:hypothetical protein